MCTKSDILLLSHKAQKAEEKKLLSQKSVGQDSDHEEELTTETQKLNDEDKQTRKTER